MNGVNALSLKGGGVKGILTLAILVKIEEKTGKPVSELFDHFGGSSVGCLITSSLLISQEESGRGAKYTAHQVYELFLKHVKNSFSWTWWSYTTSLFGLIGSKYTTGGLESIIAETCQDATLKDLIRPIVFPAYDRIKNKPFYFDKDIHADVKISDCILAVTSIPTIFPSHRCTIDDQLHDFLDSAMVTNDCSNLVLVKATSKMHIVDKSKIILVSIGTGQEPNYITDRNGILGWIPNIVNVLITGSEYNEVHQAKMSLPKDNYFMLDIPLNKAYQPDDISESTLNYYIEVSQKWITDNDQLLDTICQRLLSNH